jgi:phosphate starvation-inducible PhoH-like protein
MSRNRSVKKRERDQRRKLRRHADSYPELVATNEPFFDQPQTKKVKPLQAMTEAQGQLISQIQSKDITLVTGPAGTGKTYVAAGLAAEYLDTKQVSKIIITRPMVACGEDMGFLPGEKEEKYAPWVAPIMDVLEERLGKGYVEYLIKSKRIITSPLQFMRGSSLKDAFIICDEAQNITPDQMKMFLTRIGEGSKMVIDGDMRQSDLVDKRGVRQLSGLQDAVQRLEHIPQIGFVEFDRADIVRHGITRKILDAYEG